MKFNEFPNIQIPDCLIRLGFSDESWHNDSAARATKKMPSGAILVAWVAEENPEDREFPEGPHFGIQLMVDEDSYGDSSKTISVADFESEKAFEIALIKLISVFETQFVSPKSQVPSNGRH
jgi:hypothetical protein